MSDKPADVPAHLQASHYDPLRWLVRQSHAGKTLKDLVRQHRWKRKRAAVQTTNTKA